VKLVDANLLLYAVNEDAHHHSDARAWLDDGLGGGETIGFDWLVLLAFVRLATKEGLFPSPLSIDAAMDRVDAWVAQPSAVIVEPGVRHTALVLDLLRPLGVGGNLVNDAHLAALALEQRATVVSYDNDFGRFAGVSWETPRTKRS
jgi:toxin-antitoxin system PIN domain toxin